MPHVMPHDPRPTRCGFSLVEVVVALGIFSLLAGTVLTLALGSFSADQRGEHLTRAQALAREGLEAVRSIRHHNFSDLTSGGHGLSRAAGYWTLAGEAEALGPYTRTITIGDAYRDNGGQGALVADGTPGATLDPLTKRVTSTVTWLALTGTTGRTQVVTLMTDWLARRWLQDTGADFATGRRDSTQLTAAADGEVRLASLGDWSNPQALQSVNIEGKADATDCAVDPLNQVLYVVTNERGRGQPEFYAYDIADVTATTTGLFTLGTTEVGQDSQAVAVHGGHAYLATDRNRAELMVVRLSDFTRLGSWDTPASDADAHDVYATGTVAYVVTKNSRSQPEFFAINIADPAAIPATPLGAAEIGSDVNAVAIAADGAYAFLATADDAGELTVVRLSDYAVVRRIDLVGLTHADDATDVTVDGTLVVVVRKNSRRAELYTFDAATPARMSATPVGFVELGRDASHLAVQGGLAYVATTGGSVGLVVVDLQTYRQLGSFPAVSRADAQSVCVWGAQAYLISKADAAEVVVVRGAHGGSAVAPVGSFTSSSFDSGFAGTVWKSLTWTGFGPGTITLRLRTADTAANLNTARWVGQDGTAATAYAAPGQTIRLDPNATGPRWIQYRAYLEHPTGSTSPVVEDVTLSYGP